MREVECETADAVIASMDVVRGQPADLLMKDAERDYKTCGSCARVEHNTVGVPCWCHSLFNLNNCSSKGQLQSS